MSNTQIRGDSWYVVLYGNVLDRATGLQPQNTLVNEFVHHCAVDSNIFIGRTDPAYYNTGTPVRDYPLNIVATDIMIRNNVIYNYVTTASLASYTSAATPPLFIPCDRIYLENNTSITPTASSTFDGFSSVYVFKGIQYYAVQTQKVFNNIHYSMASTTTQYDQFLNHGSIFVGASDNNLIYGTSWSTTTTPLFGYYTPTVTFADWQKQGLQDTHSLFADPKIAVTNFMAAGFAQPSAGGPGVNKGAPITTTGNWLDARGRLRVGTPDIGAFESLSSDTTPPARPKGFRFQ